MDSIITPGGHGLGWNPELEAIAREAWSIKPVAFAQGAPALMADDRPLAPAFSLSYLVKWYFNQGQVGSCAPNSACSLFQVQTAADNVEAGDPIWEEVQLSRAFNWYEARKRDGLLGRGEGASCTNCMRAFDEVGCPVEEVWPYKPEYRWLERRPTADVYAKAVANQLTGVLDCRLDDSSRRLIMNGNPLHVGMWWPYGWDQGHIGPDGRTTGIGRGVYGHALCIDSYVSEGVWDKYAWWGINNSHGPIYPVLPEHLARLVPGYKPATPTRDYRFWARHDLLATVLNYGNAELKAAAGMEGFKTRPKLLEWGGLLS